LLHPQWQLQINGEPQQWTIDSQSPFVWRPDGQAFASYGFPVTDSAHKPKMRLGVWSLALGRQQWSYWMPEDRKPWTVNLHLPQEAAGYPALSWEGEELLQCVEMDTPQLERLHDGRSIACVVGDAVQGRVQHRPDGRPLVKPLPVRLFRWRRDLHNPLHWEAQSLPVAGQSLSWSLVHEAKDEPGATPAYAVQWGEHQLPGLWELEHLVVDGQWALLCPWGPSPLQGAKPVPWVWDGKQLNAIEMHWPVLRIRPHLQRGRAQLLVLVGCGPDNSNHASSGLWRWPLQVADEVNLAKPGWTPAYEWRDVGVNAQGVWKLLPRWREVRQIQHPCADGDYVWRLPAAYDAAWWWGGLTNHMNNEWAPEAARCAVWAPASARTMRATAGWCWNGWRAGSTTSPTTGSCTGCARTSTKSGRWSCGPSPRWCKAGMHSRVCNGWTRACRWPRPPRRSLPHLRQRSSTT
jgi:hypothetical protein